MTTHVILVIAIFSTVTMSQAALTRSILRPQHIRLVEPALGVATSQLLNNISIDFNDQMYDLNSNSQLQVKNYNKTQQQALQYSNPALNNYSNFDKQNLQKQPGHKAFSNAELDQNSQLYQQKIFNPKLSVAQNLYGKKPTPSYTQAFSQQKRNFSVHDFKSMLEISIPSEIADEYNLNPNSDGTYNPNWVMLIAFGNINIVKAFLKANLVTDKLELLDNAIDLCNSHQLHSILDFYKNDSTIINKLLDKKINLTNGNYKSSSASIMELLQTGLVSDDVKSRTVNYFAECGDYNLVRIINPTWFIEEFKYQKKLILNAQDISQEQKTILQSIYDAASINSNIQSATYQLSDQEIQKIATSGLTFSQILKYMPNQLFDTQKIFEMLNASVTAKLLLQSNPYLIQKEHHFKKIQPFKNDKFEEETLSRFNMKASTTVSSEKLLLDHGIYDKIIKIEQEMEPIGYHTFVAGRNWNFNFVQDIWNLARAVASNAPHIENLIELAPGLYDDNIYNHAIKAQTHLQKREKILNSDGCTHPNQGICLNSTLFENKKNVLEYTPTYFHYNKSIDYQGHTPEEIFKTFGIRQQWEKYKPEINRLKDLHIASSKFGELLAVSIKKDKIDSLTYIATPGAHNFSKYYHEEECKPSKVLEKFYDQDKAQYPLYQGRPVDYFYFLVAPGIPGELGRDYKVQSIHVTDPEIFAEYKKGIQQLFEAMKNDVARSQRDINLNIIDSYCKDFLNFFSNDINDNMEEID